MMRRRGLFILAMLLLADGALVPASRLRADCLAGSLMRQSTLRCHILTLRRLGCQIERVGGKLRFGYRLTAIPPDGLLEDLLAIVSVLRSRHRAVTPPAAPGWAMRPCARPSSATATRSGAAIAAVNLW
jgi:hypothetical protein